jgi:dTDP-4-dehydrorhamnose 3,5-epimerase-like enzyme
MSDIQASNYIKDVQLVTLRPFGDDRGKFLETFRKEWTHPSANADGRATNFLQFLTA